MKKEVIIVPRDKSALDVLAQMGKRTENAWIFLNQNVVENLKNSYGVFFRESKSGIINLTWKSTEEKQYTKIIIYQIGLIKEWKLVGYICASDIYFDTILNDSGEIFFIKMEG